jgi:flagellar motor component MotA
MIKGFGYFALLVFLIFCTQAGGFAPGAVIWLLSLFAVVSGSVAFGCLLFPKEFEENSLKKLLQFSKLNLKLLLKEIEELSVVVRRDGLLATEPLRKEMKDPLLKYLLKRVMDGYEKPVLAQTVQNQLKRQDELFKILQDYLDRLLQVIPVVGLIASLFQIMDFFLLTAAQKAATPASLAATAPATALSIATIFIPFLISLLLQLIFQAVAQDKITRAQDRGRLYFSILEEGVGGIQDGMNTDLLKEKIHCRLLESPRLVDA